jgi:hypothetical protein
VNLPSESSKSSTDRNRPSHPAQLHTAKNAKSAKARADQGTVVRRGSPTPPGHPTGGLRALLASPAEGRRRSPKAIACASRSSELTAKTNETCGQALVRGRETRAQQMDLLEAFGSSTRLPRERECLADQGRHSAHGQWSINCLYPVVRALLVLAVTTQRSRCRGLRPPWRDTPQTVDLPGPSPDNQCAARYSDNLARRRQPVAKECKWPREKKTHPQPGLRKRARSTM